MTERLYYQDATCKTFTARIVERLTHDDHPAVVLDRTAFYPTGGGQPNDRGKLGHALVVDVIERDTDSAVLHVLDLPADAGTFGKVGDEVSGELDWSRRFDLMQQHTGQHILSQAFIAVADADTMGFHLTDDTLTIDLDKKNLQPDDIDRAEDLANQVVFEDRPVTAHFVTAAELAQLPLRKPPKVETNIRIVQVEGFDWSPCGGTHVARTGQIGLVKIVKTERMSDGTRVEFRCGWRALADFRGKHQMISQVAGALSVSYGELDQAVSRMQAESKDLRKRLAEAEGKLLMYEAAELDAAAQDRGEFRLIARAWADREALHLRTLAKKLAGKPKTVALLGSSGAQPMFVFARSSDLAFDLVPLVRGAIERIGGKGGGGKPDFAQGGGPSAGEDQIRAAIEWAVSQVVGSSISQSVTRSIR
jgi:alanyl-tRNA synthetase